MRDWRALSLAVMLALAGWPMVSAADYRIDYGDGTVITQPGAPWQKGAHALPAHTYANNGLYKVTVTADLDCNGDGVTDAAGVVDTLVINVGNVRQSWNYGDGSAPTTSNNDPCTTPLRPVSHAYALPGSYVARYMAIDNSGRLMEDTITVTVQGIHHLEVTAAASASTCQPLPVTLRACLDPACTQVNPSYAGTVQLTTSSGHGGWSGGTGTLADPLTDDGQASYSFSPADGGQVTLLLQNAHADDLVISVAETGGSATGQSAPVAFRDNAFVVTPVTCTGTGCPGSGSTEVVAGRDHAFRIELWRRDPSTGNCAIATAYDSTKLATAGRLKAWLQRDAADPGGQAPSLQGVALPNAMPGMPNLTLSFANGVATAILRTTDTGKYRLSLRDDQSGFARDTAGNPRPISGASAMLTTRPFGLSVRSVRAAGGVVNPGSTTPGAAAFTCAGCPFSATVAAVRWQAADDANNDGVPDAGSKLDDNPLTPAYAWATRLDASAPFQPATGRLGTLSGGLLAQAGFSGGSQQANLGYSEVGSFTLRASAADYLGTVGVSVPDQGGVTVGRFHPFDFAVTLNNTPSLSPGGSGFTYLGQAFSWNQAPSVTITARNKAGQRTRNYDGAWWKLPTPTPTYSATTPLPANTALDATAATVNGFNCAAAGACAGQATLGFGGQFRVTRQVAEIAPFDLNLNIAFTVSDGEASYAGNPFVISAIAFDDGNPATTTDSQMRSGRAVLTGSYGPPNQALRLYFWTQYYTASGFVNNTLDTTTRYTASATNPACSVLRGPLACADVTVSGTAGSGQWFDLSAPGVSGALRYTLAVDPWLQYDWDGNGVVDNDPQADVVFGIFRGDDRVIHWRERR